VGDGGAVSGKPVITGKVENPFTLDRHIIGVALDHENKK